MKNLIASLFILVAALFAAPALAALTDAQTQVICRICDTRGPAVRFEPSDEWPHIAAERDAVADWDCLHRTLQCN